MLLFAKKPLVAAQFVACVLLLLRSSDSECLPIFTQNASTTQTVDLTVGKLVTRQMKGGETHSYRVNLRAGQFTHIVVNQLGIDVIVTVKGPDGQSIIEVDSPNGNYGPEYVSLLSERSGLYRIDIHSSDKQAAPGSYTFTIDDQRSADPNDRDRFLAQRLFVEGRTLEASDTTERRHEAITKYERAAALYHGAHDLGGEGSAIDALAGVFYALGEKDKASDYYRQALKILEGLNDPSAAATALLPLALLYREQGKYPDSEQLLVRTKKVYEQTLSSDSLLITNVLANLGQLYTEQGNYVAAEPLLREAAAKTEKVLGSENTDFATVLSNLAVLYFREGKLDAAAEEHTRALGIREKALGKDQTLVGESVNNLAAVYWQQGKYDLAEPLLQRAAAIYEKVSGPESTDVAAALNNLATLYQSEGKYAKAEPLCRRSLSIVEKTLGPNHPSVAAVLNTLGELYRLQGKYPLAEPLYQRSLAILEKVIGPDHPDYAAVQSNLALVYSQEGKFSSAKPLYRHSLEVVTKSLGKDHPQIALVSTNLANVYRAEGQYADAEQLIQRAVQINEKVWGPNHPSFGISLQNLGGLYYFEAKYIEAEPLLQRAISIFEKSLGPDHPNVAATLDALVVVYNGQRKFADAEAAAKRSLAIREKILGKENPDVANSLNNLAGIYHAEKKDADSEVLLLQAIEIREKVLPAGHPDLAQSINNLGRLYHDEGKYTEAEPLYKRALAMRQQALGPNHPDVGNSLLNLAEFYYARHQLNEAAATFDKAAENLKMQFRQHFTYMSEKERLAFLDTVSFFYPMYFSFGFTFREENPDLVGKIYELALWQKGFVASSIASVRTRVAGSGDKEALSLLEELTGKRTQLAQLLGTPSSTTEWRSKVDQLQQQANDLERQLVKRSAALSIEEKLANVTWRDVRAALRKDEAAIEFARFPFHDGKTWTGKSLYLALIITSESTMAPVVVPLGEAGELETDPIADYTNLVSKVPTPGAGIRFYRAFWKPLEKYFAGRKRIYVSPDGIVNQISFAVVPAEASGLVMEKYDIITVFSTKDLLRPSHPPRENSAVLIGNPKFNLEASEQKAALQKLSSPSVEWVGTNLSPDAATRETTGSQDCSNLPPGGVLCPLPATETEVNLIFSALKRADWQVERPFTQEKALEELIKRVRHPRVLHVATHGFFSRDQDRTITGLSLGLPSSAGDPMLRSGLLFAGADRTLKGQQLPSSEMDDGILTAYEATGIDLQGTELVVLSACRTGLGEIKNGEGVFGLRRALQEAGAESVLMSMWSVPDTATSELMVAFYQKWLAGKDRHEALREAQLEMRNKIKARYEGQDRPYYWGAFVLMGR
jgi:CHAT domain-containing protein/tetratricopeptide (TPR) repeat protein